MNDNISKVDDWIIPLYKIYTDDEDLQLISKVIRRGTQWALGPEIEEFEKADIQVKTIRLKENNLPKEHVSFKNFKYEEIIKLDWEESDLKHILEQKFFLVFLLL